MNPSEPSNMNQSGSRSAIQSRSGMSRTGSYRGAQPGQRRSTHASGAVPQASDPNRQPASGQNSQPAQQPSQPANPSGQTDASNGADAGMGHGNTLPIGMKIDDRYEITGILGTGGFATVYMAQHLMIDREVALKVMDTQKGVDSSYIERFAREAKIAAKIHHNNVVSIYDFGTVSQTQQPYIAMEMLRGHDLSHELAKKGPLSPHRAFVLFRPVFDALAEGHRLGIVHKDLKPENLFIVDPGGSHETLKVLDFGVARIDSGEVAKLTSAGQLLGTPRYLAPEYIKEQKVTPAIDVYQMALILSEALTGVPAVTGDPFHAMMLHCKGELRIADFLLDGPVGEVFRKAISIDPNTRYANCEEFALALDTVESYFSSDVPLQGGDPQVVAERRNSSRILGMNVDPMSNATGANPTLSGATAQPKRKSMAPIIIIAALGALLVIGIVAFMMTRSGKPTETDQTAAVDTKTTPENEDKPLEFEFVSNPAGASITIKGTPSVICDATPCKHSFKESELPLTLILKKDGFLPSELEASTGSHIYGKGKLEIALTEATKEIKSVNLTFLVKPDNIAITLYDQSGLGRRCRKSCSFDFTPSDKQEYTFTASAPGYLEYVICVPKLGESVCTNHEDVQLVLDISKETTANVELVREPPRPGKPKTNTKRDGDSAPAPQQTAPAPAQTKPERQEKKPTLMML